MTVVVGGSRVTIANSLHGVTVVILGVLNVMLVINLVVVETLATGTTATPRQHDQHNDQHDRQHCQRRPQDEAQAGQPRVSQVLPIRRAGQPPTGGQCVAAGAHLLLGVKKYKIKRGVQITNYLEYYILLSLRTALKASGQHFAGSGPISSS